MIMRKKILLVGFAMTLVVSMVYIFIPRSEEITEADRPASDKILVNQLPNLKLLGVDGSVNYSRELNGKNVLVLYNPDCDHCQREAKEIRTQLKAFENYTVWFVSSDNFENIGRFAKDYDLVGHANVHFTRTEVMEVINNFGAIATPSVYIYSDERQLIKAINGETRIEEIIKYL
jgi:peroxiredoxin